jgi:hypothetical protein
MAGVHPGTTPAGPPATKQNEPHGEGDFHSGDAPSPFCLSNVIGWVLLWTLIGAALMFAIGIIVVIVVFWTFWSHGPPTGRGSERRNPTSFSGTRWVTTRSECSTSGGEPAKLP